MKKLILLSIMLILGNVYANIQLVKADEVVVLKKGKQFSINSDIAKYKFESIKAEMINDTLDIRSINYITIYGNNSQKTPEIR